MRIVCVDGGREWDVEVRFGRPDATLADLAAAVGMPDRVLAVDGRVMPSETVVRESGLVHGSRVAGADGYAGGGRAAHGAAPGRFAPGPAVTGRPGPGGLRKPTAVLRLVGGLEAGGGLPLAAGRTVVGRGVEADVRVVASGVSRLHAAFDVLPDGRVTVTDLGSANGTDVGGTRISGSVPVHADDLVSLGGEVLLRVLPADRLGPVQRINAVREAGPGGTLPFNRPPRGGRSAAATPITVPAAAARAHRAPFSVAALLGPLAMAAATVALTGDPRYAAIAALTPVLFVANFVEDRLRGRSSARRGGRAFAARVAEFEAAVERLHAAEVRDRRAAHPDPAEVLHRATAPGTALWERRPAAEDFLQLVAGTADLPWNPPLERESGEPAPEPAAVLARRAALPQVPVVVGVSAGEAVGFEGGRRACLAVARSLLCQAVVGSGPADLTVAVFTDADRLGDWDWTKWLPHGADPRSGATRLVAVGPEQADALAQHLLAAGPPREAAGGPVLLVVVDGAALLEGRPNRLRDLIAGASVRCGALVLTARLPALCTSVVTALPEGLGRVRDVATGVTVDRVLLDGLPAAEAREAARALARFEDPELRIEGAGLPDRIALLPLLDLERVDGAAVAGHWKRRAPELRVRAVLGVTERDLFTVDLDDDGPHALIAGTTGSGKSELLRTLIASMAVDADPEHLTFALVDYKGGGALDECAALPHTVGLVTDLDEQLSERALRCLEAELHHRERLLRETGLSHVRDYQRLRDTGRGGLEPMPRLAVVIDEFATLVKALPDFVDALVGIAQRGRSLGVHLIMATQRPAGSVSDAIKNNVKLRIALRLESGGDSQDVIDDPAAAAIGSRQWGRAFYRLSAREVVPVQTALSTGVTPQTAVAAAVTALPFVLGLTADGPGAADPDVADADTDLRRLVAATGAAADAAGFAEPRRPWPDPLPAVVRTADLPAVAERGLQTAATGLPAYALADDPDRQRQYAVGWDPAAGNVLVYGSGGSGTSTALAALALSVAGALPPDRCHVFALDLGTGALAPLAGLPHTGAHIGPAERERQVRLIRLLRRELDARKARGGAAPGGEGPAPDWLVLVDNLGALLADFDKDLAGMNLIDELARVYADGPAVGIRFAVTADRSGAVPSAWAALTQQKLLMRMADPGEYGYFDVPRGAVPGFVPGRALVAATRQVIQIALPGDDLAVAVAARAAAWPGAATSAPGIGLLPAEIAFEALGARASVTGDPWRIPVGLDADGLGPTALRLYEHDHALVAGPQRSGRSTTLCAIARQAATAARPPAVVAFAPRRSPLRELPGLTALVTEYGDLEAALAPLGGPTLLLIDDADAVDDELGVLERWLSVPGPGRHLVAAGRADALRRTYGHWTQHTRDSRCGILLTPDHDLDGDLLGTTLPRHDRLAALPGRGYLVTDGVAAGVQVAR
ncbi:FtsK/SpoIIIE domain-containing protein [Actinacidiphila rubida]|uniref:DNA segregation ATPase FtsK/SpoIIIE, S-DNA-T family n=1 Tax=Actinacidiphila rubida TaxID=310780 RepID=A0A1H8JH03_9ACTN|nr:FtsK/SpoIIIE domain-containing protein [Actinacidiphila rubida]SEN79952.1 DNA segregation ATPase FtsK/SpoIIIE, S-DNA-T family [Actinacidiphila rubida]